EYRCQAQERPRAKWIKGYQQQGPNDIKLLLDAQRPGMPQNVSCSCRPIFLQEAQQPRQRRVELRRFCGIMGRMHGPEIQQDSEQINRNDSKKSTYIKTAQRNAAIALDFPQHQCSNQEAAQDKEHIHTKPSMDPRGHISVHVVEHHEKYAHGAQAVQRGEIFRLLKYGEIAERLDHSPLIKPEGATIRKSIRQSFDTWSPVRGIDAPSRGTADRD